MSRLYYAMFYAAEALLLAEGHTFSSQRAVISAFGRLLIKEGILPKELHQWLHEAFDKGQLSDYEFLTGIGDAEVAAMQPKEVQFVEQATSFLRQSGMIEEG
ncbi:MAG: HEPN domain-containing protein [Deltaproteobacteria bacterium]|nr:HEPN domain-containing protein [Deltaproteobacteria bacterium]